MIHYDSSTAINRPASEVFDWLVDPVRMDRWTSMSDGRWLTGAPGRKGATIEASIHLGPITSKLAWEMTEYIPGERIAFTPLPGGLMRWFGSYDLSGDDAATVVRSTGDIRFNGPLRLLEPLVRGEVERGEAAEIEKLKAILELSQVPTTP